MNTFTKSIDDYQKSIASPFKGDLKQVHYALYKKRDVEPDEDEDLSHLHETNPCLLAYLDIFAFDVMLRGKAFLVCHFGSIIKGQHESSFQLSTQWCHRAMHQNYVWWHNPELCPRVFQEGDEKDMLKVTWCRGFENAPPIIPVVEEPPAENQNDGMDVDIAVPVGEVEKPTEPSIEITQNQDEFVFNDEFFNDDITLWF